jgi:hypothetical protein
MLFSKRKENLPAVFCYLFAAPPSTTETASKKKAAPSRSGQFAIGESPTRYTFSSGVRRAAMRSETKTLAYNGEDNGAAAIQLNPNRRINHVFTKCVRMT